MRDKWLMCRYPTTNHQSQHFSTPTNKYFSNPTLMYLNSKIYQLILFWFKSWYMCNSNITSIGEINHKSTTGYVKSCLSTGLWHLCMKDMHLYWDWYKLHCKRKHLNLQSHSSNSRKKQDTNSDPSILH